MENNVLTNGQQGTDDGLNEIRTQMDNILKSKKPNTKRNTLYCESFEKLLAKEGQHAETEQYLIKGLRYGSMEIFITYYAKKQEDPVDALNGVISGKTIQEFREIDKLRFYASVLCLVLTETHYKSMFPICAEKMAILSRGNNGHLANGSVRVVKEVIQHDLKKKTVSYPDLKTIKIQKHAENFRELICAVIEELVTNGKTDEKLLLSLAEWVGYKKAAEVRATTEIRNLPATMQSQTRVIPTQVMHASTELPKSDVNPIRPTGAESEKEKAPALISKDMPQKEASAATAPNHSEILKSSDSGFAGKIQSLDEFHHVLAMLDEYGTEVFSNILKQKKEIDDRATKLSKAQQEIAVLEGENQKASDLLNQEQKNAEELASKVHEFEETVTGLRKQISVLEKDKEEQRRYIDHQKQTMSIYQVDTKNNSEEEKKALATKLKQQYLDYKEIVPNKEKLTDVEAILAEIIDDIFGILKKSGIDAIN